MSMGVNKKSLKASVAGGLLSPPGSLKEDSCAAPKQPPAPRSSKKHMPENDRSKNTHTLPGRKNIYLLSLTHFREVQSDPKNLEAFQKLFDASLEHFVAELTNRSTDLHL